MKTSIRDTDLLDFSRPHGMLPWLEALRIDRRHLTAALQISLPEPLADLLDVAMAVYTADRICRRSPGKRQDREELAQGRVFDLRIPVRDPEHWQQDTIRSSLTKMLEALTFDTWNFEFCAARPQRCDAYQIKVFREPITTPFVGLFSGGLDSLAGAALQGAANPHATGILVIATTNTRLKQLQRRLVMGLNEGGFSRYLPVFIPHPLDALTNIQFTERKQEKTQRTRGFIYPALGAVVAVLAGTDTLYVYENGVGALNLPFTRATVGADHTRAMHPVNLLLLSRFFSDLLGKPFKICNPSMWLTKGMMCAELKQLGLGELTMQSASCDGYPLRGDYSQCGKCTSCLLRRVSLSAGGLLELEQKERYYKYDVLSMPTTGNEVHLYPLRFMLAQVERMHEALGAADPIRALLRIFPELYEARTSLAVLEERELGAIDADLLRIFDNYIKEWDWFLIHIPSVSTPIRDGGPLWPRQA